MNIEIMTSSLLEKAFLIKRNRQSQLDISGESYNIFSELNLEYSEVTLHSRFLAGLLNPKGSHCQKDLFLRKFIDKINLPELDITFIEDAKIYVEEYVGPISNDCVTGGSIDIVIKIPNNQVIIIENKINAGDQRHQLIRYKNAYPGAYILYLSKNGCKPTPYSTHDQLSNKMIVDFENEPKHKCISYKVDIIEWLTECYKDVIRFPLLRETIYQYLTTIKKITNQITDTYMSDEIANIILNSSTNLEGYFLLRDEKINKAVESKLLLKFIDQVENVAKELNLSYTEMDIERDLGHKPGETEIVFHIPNSQIVIALGFDNWRMDFSIGIGGIDRLIDASIKVQISKQFSDIFGKDENYPNWYYLLYFRNSKHGDEYLATWDAGKLPVWGAINDGSLAKKMSSYFKTILKELEVLKLAV